MIAEVNSSCLHSSHTKLRNNQVFYECLRLFFSFFSVRFYFPFVHPGNRYLLKYSTVVLEFIFESSYVFNIKIKDKKKCLFVLCDCSVQILTRDDCD